MRKKLFVMVLAACLAASLAVIGMLDMESVTAAAARGSMAGICSSVIRVSCQGKDWCKEDTTCDDECYKYREVCEADPCKKGCIWIPDKKVGMGAGNIATMPGCVKKPEKCENGKKKCVGKSLYVCENEVWVDKGSNAGEYVCWCPNAEENNPDVVKATVHLCGGDIKAYVRWNNIKDGKIKPYTMGSETSGAGGYIDSDLVKGYSFYATLYVKEIKRCLEYECISCDNGGCGGYTNCGEEYCNCFEQHNTGMCTGEVPDKDGDGIKGNADKCPDKKGVPECNGCPKVWRCSKDPNAPKEELEESINDDVMVCCWVPGVAAPSCQYSSNDCNELGGQVVEAARCGEKGRAVHVCDTLTDAHGYRYRLLNWK